MQTRSPAKMHQMFPTTLQALPLNYRNPKKSKELILIGDMNTDLLKMGEQTEHKATAEFNNCVLALHLLPLITRPTRITYNTSTLIDNSFSTLWPKVIKSSTVYC